MIKDMEGKNTQDFYIFDVLFHLYWQSKQREDLRATINPVLIKENKNSAHVLHFLCCNCTKFNTTQDFQYKVFWRMKTQDKVISFLFLDLNSFLKRLQWEFTATWQIDWVRITVAIKIVTMHICFISEVIVTTAMVATLTP